MSANPWDDVLAQRHGDKLKPESNATATASQPAAETQAQIVARVHAEEAERTRDIISWCNTAGKPERAAGFIASGKKLSEVLAVLNAEMSNGGAQRKGEDVEAFAARRGVRRI